MADTEETALCGHCKKEVAKVNLPMHEAHCQRFLALCTKCDELVPKDQLDEHQKEQHTLVRCKMCNGIMERWKLPDHETDECTERLETCEFCDAEFPLSSLKDHTVACGSRTERCPDCNHYVTLKDRQQHEQICAYNLNNDYADSTKEESFYEMMKPGDNLQSNKSQDSGDDQSQDSGDDQSQDSGDDHSRDPDPAQFSPPGQNLSLSDLQKKKSEAFGWSEKAEISTCPHCHLALPLAILQWHENKCKIYETLKQMEC